MPAVLLPVSLPAEGGRPELAEPALVPGPDRAAGGIALADPRLEGSAISDERLGVAPEHGVVEPSCVAASGISEELSAFYTVSQLVSICMRCAYFATIGQSFDWREPIGLQERLEGRSSHNGEFSVMSRSRSQGAEVTIVTGDVSRYTVLNNQNSFFFFG